MAAGLVLVHQMPGSAKCGMFLTIEDETSPANIFVWPKLFERRRRVVLGSSMMAINVRVQREGMPCISSPSNCSISLSALADRDGDFKLPTAAATSLLTRRAAKTRGIERRR